MRNIFFSLFLFCLIAVSSSCEEEDEFIPVIPVAFFNLEEEQIDTFQEFEIVSQSTDAVSYFWDFGNGSTSTDEIPTHSYSEIGDYVVSLTVTSETGDTDTLRRIISVLDRQLVALWLRESKVELPPDLLLFFGSSDDIENNYIFTIKNFGLDNFLPFGGGISLPSPLFLKEQFFIMLIENNAPLNSFDSNDILLGGTNLDLSKIKGEVSPYGGFIDLSNLIDSEGNPTENYTLRIGYTLVELPD
ncbi:MAG: PKD domain-containing protein [Ekhidna sp.]|nr:PKD domain-containing protein [Ekhidna sp.]